MAFDRWTRVLLALIAAELWMNALNTWIRPPSAGAQVSASVVQQIQEDVRDISIGICLNSKIC